MTNADRLAIARSLGLDVTYVSAASARDAYAHAHATGQSCVQVTEADHLGSYAVALGALDITSEFTRRTR